MSPLAITIAVTIGLAAGGLFTAVLGMLYREAVVKRLDRIADALEHIHECLHRQDKRITVLEFDRSRREGVL
jgi:hypothetical protein